MKQRRQFLKHSAMLGIGSFISPSFQMALGSQRSELFVTNGPVPGKLSFDISLAEFSFAGELMSGKMTNMQFPEIAKKEFGIQAVEYVSGFFNNKHTDPAYLKELKQRTDDLGVRNHLIMVDGENIANLNADKRKKAVESHYAWVDAAKYLGCDKIRVNLGDTAKALNGEKDDAPEEAAAAAADGYRQLLEYALKEKMDVIVENHFGNSTDVDWLVSVLKNVNMPNSGLLPDFGNFCRERSKPTEPGLKGLINTKCVTEYDRYEGVKKMMPYAKGISAKTHKFDTDGNETETDFIKMFEIIKAHGFEGYVGVEYEGGFIGMLDPSLKYLSSTEGVRMTKRLLERVQKKLS